VRKVFGFETHAVKEPEMDLPQSSRKRDPSATNHNSELQDPRREDFDAITRANSEEAAPGRLENDSGWLGIEIGEVTKERAKDLRLTFAGGVFVVKIELDSPAAKAGLKEGDVITHYDGTKIEGTSQFRKLVHETSAGRTVPLAVVRNGGSLNISVGLTARSAFLEKQMEGKMRDFSHPHAFPSTSSDQRLEALEALDSRTPLLGISAEELTSQLGEYFGVPNGAGILVRGVHRGTSADKAGVKAGDVIIAVGEKTVQSLKELREQLRPKTDGSPVGLRVLRKGKEINFEVRIETPQLPAPSPIPQRARM
jgi:serine protease Do